MLRWLLRLLLVGLILAAIGFVVTRLMGQDEDFDDFDDLDEGFEFEETPVEIDVPAEDGASAGTGATGGAARGAATADLSAGGDSAGSDSAEGDSAGSVGGTNEGDGGDGGDEADGGDGAATGTKLTDITGIGPAYEARLQAIGIESVDDLLNADAANLAEQLGVIGGQSAVEDWLAQARQLAADGSQGADGGA